MGLQSFAILAYSFGSMIAGAIAGVWRAPVAAQVVGFTGITLVLAAVTPKLCGRARGGLLSVGVQTPP